MADTTKSSNINPAVLKGSKEKGGSASGMPSVGNPAETAVRNSIFYGDIAQDSLSQDTVGKVQTAGPSYIYPAGSPVSNPAGTPFKGAGVNNGSTNPHSGSGTGGGPDLWIHQLSNSGSGYNGPDSWTVTKATANAVRTAAGSNQEEYQTVARKRGMERLEDMAVILAASDCHEAYADVQKYGQGILDYSTDKGQGRSLDAQGQSIVDCINASSPVQVDLDFLRKNAGSIYSASSRDGSQIILPDPNGSAVSIETGIAIKPEEGKNSILQEIGNFNSAYKKQNADFKHLTTDAGVDEQTLISLNSVRTGNYKALDGRLKLTERYNNHVFANNGYKDPSDRRMIRNFSGKKEEIDRLKNAVDEHGNSIFTAAELAELDECIHKNGFGTEQGKLGMMARDASRRSRQRIASKALDDYQGETLGIIQKSTRLARTAGRLNNEVRGAAGEFRAASVNKKVNNLLNQRDKLTGSLKNGSAKQMEKVSQKLEKHGRELGADMKTASSSELRKRASAAQDRAKEIRQARRDMSRAVHGLGKKERKEVVMRLRMEDALACNNSVKAERLAAKQTKLSNKISKIQNRKRSLANAVKKVKKKAGAKAAGTAAGKVFAKTASVANGIRTAVSTLFKHLIAFLAPILGGVVLIILLAAMIVTIVVFIVLLFFPDMGDKNVLQTVNEAMNAHETAQLQALQKKTAELVRNSDVYQEPETLASRPVDSMCWQKDGMMYNGQIYYHGRAYPIEGLYVRRSVRVTRKNSVGRTYSTYETRWCEILPEDSGMHTFYLQYKQYGWYGAIQYTNKVWDSDGEYSDQSGSLRTLWLDNTADRLPKLSTGLRADSSNGRYIYSARRYVQVNFGDTDDDGVDNTGWTELRDSDYGNRECYYVRFTIPGDHFWEGSSTILYCMKFGSDGRLERNDLRERLHFDDRDDKIRPDIDLDYDVVDENGKPSRICNCMQGLTLYRYYYKWTDEGQEDPDGGDMAEDSWTDVMFVGNYERKMKQVWDLTHFIKTTHVRFPFFWTEETDYEGWNKALEHLKLEDIRMEDGLPGLYGEGRRSTHTEDEVRRGQCDKVCYYYARRENDGMFAESDNSFNGIRHIPILDITGPYCCGHYQATVDVITTQDMENIASGNTLEGRFGINIEYAEDFSDAAKEDIKDLIGSYDDGFVEGFQNWADFEVYFGPAKNMLLASQINDFLEQMKARGRISEKTEAFLKNALDGCGKFTYQKDAYTMEKWDVSAGRADSAGYVNWARNKTGLYAPEIKEYTIDDWAGLAVGNRWRVASVSSRTRTVTPASREMLNLLEPGSLLIKGGSGSDRNSIAIWTGLFTTENKDGSGLGEPVVIECTSGSANGSVMRTNDDVRNWLYYVPPGRI